MLTLTKLTYYLIEIFQHVASLYGYFVYDVFSIWLFILCVVLVTFLSFFNSKRKAYICGLHPCCVYMLTLQILNLLVSRLESTSNNYLLACKYVYPSLSSPFSKSGCVYRYQNPFIPKSKLFCYILILLKIKS